MNPTVVTSENLAEFNSQRLGLTAPAVAEEIHSEPVVKQQITSEPEQTDAEPQDEPEKADDKPKVNLKLEKRFSELTKQREDARREAEQERIARQEIEARLKALEMKDQPQPAEPNAKPNRAKFSDEFKYAEALADWSVENALKNREKDEDERKQIAQRQEVLNQWNQRQEEVAAKLPDYVEVIKSSTVGVSDAVRDAIIESEVGPRILYHLAQNPDLAVALASKTVTSALREIGKLEAKLSGEKATEPVKPVAKPSNAPTPIQPIRATTPVDSPIATDGEFHGTYEAWKQARRAGRIK